MADLDMRMAVCCSCDGSGFEAPKIACSTCCGRGRLPEYIARPMRAARWPGRTPEAEERLRRAMGETVHERRARRQREGLPEE